MSKAEQGIPRERAAWIQGGDAQCCRPETLPDRPYRFVLLGAPGAGKGTQAELLSHALGSCHLSTGDVFRAARCMDANDLSPAMVSALGYMQRGELVPDDIVIDMVRERVSCLKCDCGFVLDGFPRTVSQAATLEMLLEQEHLKLDGVLSYELAMPTVIERLGGRRTCRDCKTTYHVATKPSARGGVCDKCGGELYQRVDDTPESIKVRLDAYHESTRPLEDYYRERGLLIPIPADGTPQEVFDQTLQEIKSRVS
jgi:adenylate kinase